MSNAKITFTPTTVTKTYPPHEFERWGREVFIYTNYPYAAPKLINAGHGWLEMERCTPILNLKPEDTLHHREHLWGLLSRIQDDGWNHRDIDLVNVVVHSERGPLLIDFENAAPTRSTLSVDQHGATRAGVQPAWAGKGPEGVWWNGPTNTCPGPWWR